MTQDQLLNKPGCFGSPRRRQRHEKRLNKQPGPAFYKQLNFCNLGSGASSSSIGTAWPPPRPLQDDGWSAAGNKRLYQAALSPSSRSRQARFLSNCIGFSNFLFQDKWIEILKGGGCLLSATRGWLLLMIHLVFLSQLAAGYYSQSSPFWQTLWTELPSQKVDFSLYEVQLILNKIQLFCLKIDFYTVISNYRNARSVLMPNPTQRRSDPGSVPNVLQLFLINLFVCFRDSVT